MNPTTSLCKIILLISLLVIAIEGVTQNKADSLLNIIDQNLANSETYNQLALEYYLIDLNQSKEFALKALNLAKGEHNSAQEAFAYNRLGIANIYLSNLDTAFIYFEKSATFFEKLKMDNEQAGSTACCAKVYDLKFEYEKAIQKYNQALKIFEKVGVSEYYVQTLVNIGNLYSKLNDFSNAQKYYDKALENKSYLKDPDLISLFNQIGVNYQKNGNFKYAMSYFEKAFNSCDLGKHNLILAITYQNIGILYIAWDKKENALKYLEKGLEVSKSVGSKQFINSITLMIADCYLDLNQNNKAKDYYTQILNDDHTSKDIFVEARGYLGLAKVYNKEHLYDKAIKYSSEALDLFEKTGKPFYIASSHYILANNYLAISNLKNTKIHLDEAISIANQNSLIELKAQINLLYARYNNIIGKGLNSSEFYEKYITTTDSLFSQQNQNMLAKFQVELDNMEKDYKLKEAEQLNLQKELELSQKKRQIIFISTISLLLLLGILVFATMNIKMKKTNRTLFLKNKELLKQEIKSPQTGSGMEISESLQNEIIFRLNTEMDENKIYLKNDLTLQSLSKVLGTNSSYLSQIIKTAYNCNFSTFLNKIRIIEAQKMILDKKFDHYTIDAISKECGYNSKSTFNKAFKDFTGLTPQKYKKQNSLNNTITESLMGKD